LVLISLNDVAVGFGGAPVVDGASLQIEDGERIGLVGRNGSGKSTLLNLLHGGLLPDRGTASRGADVRVSLLPQDVPEDVPGTVYDVSQALFTPLKNEVGESVYKKLDFAIRKTNVSDLKEGAFPILPDDQDGAALAREADPLRLQMKVDFASPVQVKGLKDPLVLIEGTQVSNSYRRCLRLFEDKEPLGGCVEMPHVLMTETRQLDFVAYDPSRAGSPFVFAYTTEAPLWGHERWGFQVNAQGAKLFLRDALDPKCREGF